MPTQSSTSEHTCPSPTKPDGHSSHRNPIPGSVSSWHISGWKHGLSKHPSNDAQVPHDSGHRMSSAAWPLSEYECTDAASEQSIDSAAQNEQCRPCSSTKRLSSRHDVVEDANGTHRPHDRGQPSTSAPCPAAEYGAPVVDRGSRQSRPGSCHALQDKYPSSRNPDRSAQCWTASQIPHDIGQAESRAACPSSEYPCTDAASSQTNPSCDQSMHGYPCSSTKTLSSLHEIGSSAAAWHTPHARGHAASSSAAWPTCRQK